MQSGQERFIARKGRSTKERVVSALKGALISGAVCAIIIYLAFAAPLSTEVRIAIVFGVMLGIPLSFYHQYKKA